MKKQKRLLSLILSFAIVATTFSSLGNIFSGAADAALDESLKVTKHLTAYSGDATEVNNQIANDWAAKAKDKSGNIVDSIVSLNANPERSLVGSSENLYEGYNFEVNGTNFNYAKEGGQYYVDWADNTVESVSYTILPNSYFNENANFNYYTKIPIGVGQAFGYGMNSTVGYTAFRSQGVDGGNNWLQQNILAYCKDDTVITKGLNGAGNLSTLFPDRSWIAVASETTITVNYTKTDGKYYVKNIVAEINPDKTVTNVTGITTKYSKTSFTFNFKKTIEVTDPQFCLPSTSNAGSGDNAFYNYTYIKDASITYYQNPDTAKIPEFVESYNKIKDLTAEDAVDSKDDIVDCMNIYNGYDDTYKGYVGEERYAKLTELYNAAMKPQLTEEVKDFLTAYEQIKDLTADTVTAENFDALKNCIDIYNDYDDVHKNFVSEQYDHLAELYARAAYLKTGDSIKTSSINANMLSDKTVSEQMWQYTSLEDHGFKFSPTAANPNQMYFKEAYFKNSEIGNFGFTFDGKTATQRVTGKSYTAKVASTDNANLRMYTANFINYVKKDFVPENPQAVSATVSLKIGSYYIFFGENNTRYGDRTKYNEGAVAGGEDDFPRFGIRFDFNEDGTVKAYFNYIKLTYCGNSQHTTMDKKYLSSMEVITSNLLRWSNDNGYKLNMDADTVKINIDLSHKYVQKLGGTDITYIHPVITLTDSNGNVISQPTNMNNSGETKPVCDGNGLNPSSQSWFPTDVTGLAISSFSSDFVHATSGTTAQPYDNTLTLYDFDIVGGAAVNALGATIKKTTTIEEQDLRFGFKFGGENSYLINKGYHVANYGAVVAVNGALEDGDSLTLTSQYKAAYSSLGAPKVVTINGAPTYGEQYNVRINLSAKDSKNLGLVYRVRPYITYSKEGAEDIVIYSEDTSATNAYTPRSIFSTAKNIAKAMAANANFESVKQATYTVKSDEVSYDVIEGIFNGTNTGKSYDKIEGTDIMLAEALTAFTAKHIDLLQ